MKHTHGPNAQFPETRWTWIIQAGNGVDDAATAIALKTLCEMYWHPVYAFLRHQRHSPHDSEDLTQGFFGHLLESPLFENASPDAGRFRNYLLGALRNFVRKETRRNRAAKRGGGIEPLSLDFSTAETRLVAEKAGDDSPDHLFDRQWAWELLTIAMARVEKRYLDSGKGGLFELLKPRLLGASDGPPLAEIARLLGMEEGAVKVAWHRMKARFKTVLREELARTLRDDKDVDAELRYLISLFAKM